MSVRDRALLIKKYSHIVLTRLRVCEPAPREPGQPVPWADAQIEQYFETTENGTVTPFLLMSALLVYPGLNYAHGCHLATLKTTIQWLNHGIEQWAQAAGMDPAGFSALPPRGAVAIDIKTLVPYDKQKARITSGLTLYANDSKVATVADMIKATNPEMAVQLGHAVKDIWAKASPASAQAGPPS